MNYVELYFLVGGLVGIFFLISQVIFMTPTLFKTVIKRSHWVIALGLVIAIVLWPIRFVEIVRGLFVFYKHKGKAA